MPTGVYKRKPGLKRNQKAAVPAGVSHEVVVLARKVKKCMGEELKGGELNERLIYTWLLIKELGV